MLTCVRPSGYKNKAFMKRRKTLRRLLYQTYCLFGFIFACGWVYSICLRVHMYTHRYRSEVNIRCLTQITFLLRKDLSLDPALIDWAEPPSGSGNLHIYTRIPTAQTAQPCLCFPSERWGSKLRSSWLYSRGLADAHLPCPSVVFLFVFVTITFFPHSPVSCLSSVKWLCSSSW